MSAPLAMNTTDALPEIEDRVVAALMQQRARLLQVARALDEREWHRATRCADWDVQQVLLHVCGANRAVRAVLLHERDAVAENFDPWTTPNAYVDSRSGEPFAETIADLESSSAALYDAIATARTERPAPQCQAVWGRPVDWRLFVTHFFWDAWLHERDIVMPLGRDFATDAAETELAVAYGLLTAGVASSFVERTFVEELDLQGLGAGVFRVVVSQPGAAEVSIIGTPGGGALGGETMDVVDAIAGRHCEVHVALHTSVERVHDLGMLRAFLMTPG